MIRKVKDMRSALESKGFRKDDRSHHVYWLFIDGRKSSVRTFFSHGESEYGDSLLGKVRKQMHLAGAEFNQFMDCHMTGDAYVQHLKQANIVVLPKTQAVPLVKAPGQQPTPKRKKR